MATLKDADGREWKVEFPVSVLRVVLRDGDIDLAAIQTGDPAVLAQLFNIMPTVCAKQMRDRHLSEDELWAALDTIAPGEIVKALVEGLTRAFAVGGAKIDTTNTSAQEGPQGGTRPLVDGAGPTS